MITKEELLKIGFHPAKATHIMGHDSGQLDDVYFVDVNGITENFVVDLEMGKCASCAKPRSTAYPYPIPAYVLKFYPLPSTIELLNEFYFLINGCHLYV